MLENSLIRTDFFTFVAMEMRHIINGTFFTLSHLDEIVTDCRVKASGLDLVIHWRIKGRTASASLKWNSKHTLWNAEYKDSNPHRMLCLMYAGIHAELTKRTEENRRAKIRMEQEEKEREEERRVMQMQPWSSRR